MSDLRTRQIEAAWTIHEQHKGHPTDDRGIPGMLDRLAEAQNWRCCYCGARMCQGGETDLRATFEHVIPRCDGGSNRKSNLVIACMGCNRKRGCLYRPEHLEAIYA